MKEKQIAVLAAGRFLKGAHRRRGIFDLHLADFIGIHRRGMFLWAIKTLPAFPAAVRPVGHDKQDPELKYATPLGSVHVRASTQGTGFLLLVNKQS